MFLGGIFMPNCPNCKEFYFGSPNVCPKCYYDFAKKKVIDPETAKRDQQLENERRQAEREQKLAEERQRQAERVAAERKRLAAEEAAKKRADDTRSLTLSQNPLYEYKTEFIKDDRSGMLDQSVLNSTLNRYAADGWKLHTIFVNESGKNMSSFGTGGVSIGTNSTVEVTVLVFERCVKPAEYTM